MANHGNAGQKLNNVPTSIPLRNDLSNWIMDSSCTCHMSPFRSDFVSTSFIYDKRTVEVADGSTVPAEQSGTVRFLQNLLNALRSHYVMTICSTII